MCLQHVTRFWQTYCALSSSQGANACASGNTTSTASLLPATFDLQVNMAESTIDTVKEMMLKKRKEKCMPVGVGYGRP